MIIEVGIGRPVEVASSLALKSFGRFKLCKRMQYF